MHNAKLPRKKAFPSKGYERIQAAHLHTHLHTHTHTLVPWGIHEAHTSFSQARFYARWTQVNVNVERLEESRDWKP